MLIEVYNRVIAGQLSEGIAGYDAVIRLGKGRWGGEEKLAAITLEGMTLRQIVDALNAGKAPRIGVYDNWYYGDEWNAVYSVSSAIIENNEVGAAEVYFNFFVYSSYYSLRMSETENGEVATEINEWSLTMS